jgi:hypothetical protein
VVLGQGVLGFWSSVYCFLSTRFFNLVLFSFLLVFGQLVLGSFPIGSSSSCSWFLVEKVLVLDPVVLGSWLRSFSFLIKWSLVLGLLGFLGP